MLCSRNTFNTMALDIKDDEIIVPECTWTGSVAPVTYKSHPCIR